MKKLLKIVAWLLLGIVSLVVVLLLAIPLWLGPTVKAVANKVAPEYTGTKFSLGEVGINPYNGKFGISGLHVGNPEGYPVPEAISVGKFSVDVDMGSLFSDTIVIRDITLDSIYASYVSANGVNNLEWIAEHAKEKAGPSDKEEKPEKEEEDKGPGKKVIIEKLTISGARVKVSVMPEVPIPTIVLKDIGKDKGGATWEEVGQVIMDALTKAASSVGEGLTAAFGALGKGAEGIVGGATNVLGTATKALGDAVDKVGGATNVLGTATKALGDAVEKVEAKKVLDAGKSVGESVLNAGKSVGGGVLDAGKSVGGGVLDAGKSVGEGAKGALKKVGNLFGN